jgi:multidrug efflux pump subunit AcrB
MLALGFSANTISLLALVLAIGIVVDDAIVVVEAVEHVLDAEPQLTPAEAAEKAMSQVTAPIIAITLVLLSVFVPTAFIPGITGQLYQQFAVAVSVSMLISAVNALSLSPALCAVLLRHRGRRRGLIAFFQRAIDRSRDGYSAIVQQLARRVLITAALVVAFVFGAGWLAKVVATGFLPDEDQGAFLAEVQLPDAASLNRTNKVVAQVEKMIQDRPWTQSVVTISGYSLIDNLALPNKAAVIVGLKPFDERTDKSLSVFSALTEVNALFRQIAAANVVAFNLPPIPGLGTAAGFELQLQTLSGAKPEDLAAVSDGLVIAANQNPALANVYTTYGAEIPAGLFETRPGARRDVGGLH